SRNVDPSQTAVLTVGTIHSGDAFNVISGEATLTGTTRSFDPTIDTLLKRRIQEVAEAICQAFGATCEVRFLINIPTVINSQAGVFPEHSHLGIFYQLAAIRSRCVNQD